MVHHPRFLQRFHHGVVGHGDPKAEKAEIAGRLTHAVVRVRVRVRDKVRDKVRVRDWVWVGDKRVGWSGVRAQGTMARFQLEGILWMAPPWSSTLEGILCSGFIIACRAGWILGFGFGVRF